jgi:cytoskeleton protein RodZ
VFEIGNSLREARYRQQLDLPEIEQATKIRSRYLRALEEETFDLLPAQTYVKGFLRTYADYLGLDGQLYVDEYNSRYSAGEEEHEPVVARRTSSISRRHRRLESRGVLLALAGIGVLLALVIAAFKFSDTGNQAILNLSTTNGKTSTSVSTNQRTHPTAPKPARFRLFLTAAYGNSWMNVRSGSQNGRDRFNGTLLQGHSLYFRGRRLWINFGNAGNLTATLNGRAVAIPSGGAVLVTSKGISRAPAAA